ACSCRSASVSPSVMARNRGAVLKGLIMGSKAMMVAMASSIMILKRPKKFQLDVKQKVQHIPIFYHVVFTFLAQFACVFCALFAFVLNEVIVGDGIGADKTAFKIGVDNTGGLGRGGADRNGPGTHFFYAGGEVSL